MGRVPRGHRRGRRPRGRPPPAPRSTAWSRRPPPSAPRSCAAIADGLGRAQRGDRRADRRARSACRSSCRAMIQVGLPIDDVRLDGRSSSTSSRGRSRSATRSSCASRSASSARSRRGTTRCTRSPRRSRPALAAGCTVVLKPSEVAPLNAFILAEIIDEVGLPAGVFNLVHRASARSSARRSPRTPTSTWSRSPARRAPGKRVSRAGGAQTVKRVALELGGKSPNVILDDADLERGGHRRRRQVLPQLRPDLHAR